MTPFEFLREECESVREALRETLRHDYGPERSREYFAECKSRLDLISEALEKEAEPDATDIAAHMRSLAAIGSRISLIERSHLGEFSWPFADAIRIFAEKLFVEEDLSFDDAEARERPPIVHVIAEGMDYQVVDDSLARTRRILIVAFPRQLKHHVLLHAIFGHELGHPAARTDATGKVIARNVLSALASGALGSEAAAREWLHRDNVPAAVAAELATWIEPELPDDVLQNWRTEIFCDLFGLRLFGLAFAAAHRAILEPLSAWPSEFNLSSATHPPYPVRRRVLASAIRLMEWNKPITSTKDGSLHDAEKAMIAYAAEDTGEDWLTVLDDAQLKKILSSLDEVFAPHAEIAFIQPTRDCLCKLIERLTLARPPTLQSIDNSGKATNERVPIQHALYAGWCFWFGRDALRNTMLRERPRLRQLGFLEINRLCEHALLQQRAIDAVLDWPPT